MAPQHTSSHSQPSRAGANRCCPREEGRNHREETPWTSTQGPENTMQNAQQTQKSFRRRKRRKGSSAGPGGRAQPLAYRRGRHRRSDRGAGGAEQQPWRHQGVHSGPLMAPGTETKPTSVGKRRPPLSCRGPQTLTTSAARHPAEAEPTWLGRSRASSPSTPASPASNPPGHVRSWRHKGGTCRQCPVTTQHVRSFTTASESSPPAPTLVSLSTLERRRETI